ncbi:MAG: hypothetical protein ACOC47_00760 [Alkalispirochaetaceae bacterium]|jgi:membrane protein required for beta-lactamase induction
MTALLVGIVFVLFAIYSVLPVAWSLQWWDEVLLFLQGGIPILAVFIGLIAIFIGIADIKDKIEAKKEEEEEAKAAAAEAQASNEEKKEE